MLIFDLYVIVVIRLFVVFKIRVNKNDILIFNLLFLIILILKLCLVVDFDSYLVG